MAMMTLGLKAQELQPDARYKLIRESYTINDDGTSDIQYRKEITLYRNRAITAYADKGETFIMYNPAFETLTINESYTMRADGSKVETPKNAFIDQLPSECTRCGRFNGLREMAIVHTALEPNCTIVLDYTIHRLHPWFDLVINMQKDCPVDRYELTFAYPSDTKIYSNYEPKDGSNMSQTGFSVVREDIPQSWADPYLPDDVGKLYQVRFCHLPEYSYNQTSYITEAKQLVEDLQEDNDSAHYAANICQWVMQNVNENAIPYDKLGFQYAFGRETFRSNCGTLMDKALLMADLLTMAGFEASVNNPKPQPDGDFAEVVTYTVNGKKVRYPLRKQPAVPVTVVRADATLPFDPIPLIGNPSPYYRFVLPKETGTYSMNPALLTSVRKAPLAVAPIDEVESYTIYLPPEMELVKPVKLRLKATGVGDMQVTIRQSGKKVTVVRKLRMLGDNIVIDPVRSPETYKEFRTMLAEWESSKQFYIQRHNQ